ncbi:peptidoglycan DD-metalloendopeptidase family protein [Nocardioides cheoyonin]|uniref:peptidoglycan DD-metalloendopeptidase family protein n=1 Tax=Nocardioides cheoyonin TaxID=3156615 RepID=UPI0032B42E1C
MTPPSGGYVGKRRALPADRPADERPPAKPYVGKRRALPVDEPSQPRTEQRAEQPAEEPVARHRPNRVVLRESELSDFFSARTRVEAEREAHERTEDPRISTGELRALVEAELQDTAPRPRLRAPLPLPPELSRPLHRPRTSEADRAPEPTGLAGQTPTVQSPAARKAADQAPAPLAVPGPRRPPEPSDAAGLPKPLFSDETSLGQPRLSVAATLTTDLSFETTTTLPAVGNGGGRRRASGRRTLRKGLPSLPVAVGAAALAAAVGGAMLTAQPDSTPVAESRVATASALTGTSETAGVGGGRDQEPVSRSANRAAAAQSTADKRAKALAGLDQQAESQDKYLNSNQWGLPIAPGVYHLTGRFGDVSGLWATIHTGLDFAAPYGTPIHAVARGTVTSTGYDGSYGNKTVVTLPDGTELWYCHQSEYAVSVGDTVEEGEVIGYVGATGNVTGPHVHLEVRPGGGDPVDPDEALRQHGVNPDAY